MGERCGVCDVVAKVAAGALVLCAGSPCVAEITTEYGIDFVNVGDAGNAPWIGSAPSGSLLLSERGSVGYEYRIAKFEMTTSLWMEFVNTYSVTGASWSNFAEPVVWAATPDPSYAGPGRRWVLDGQAQSADLPIFGITWRDAARYANWLHNDKQPTLAAIQTGAYDTATWGWDPLRDHYTDGDRLPGAKFWIPTIDEWMKAAHWDPDMQGPGQGGWWDYPYQSHTAPVPGYPGIGETSAGEETYGPLGTGFSFPVGAYEGHESAWGLMDASGAANELIEDWFIPEFGSPDLHTWRRVAGSTVSDPHTWLLDHVGQMSVERPDARGWSTLRIATSVPSPSVLGFVVLSGFFATRRIR